MKPEEQAGKRVLYADGEMAAAARYTGKTVHFNNFKRVDSYEFTELESE